MLHMRRLVEFRRVHRAVRPIEISVVQDDQERDRHPEPEHPELGEIIIFLEQADIRGLEDENVHRDEDTNGFEGVFQLHLNLFRARRRFADFPGLDEPVHEDPKHEEPYLNLIAHLTSFFL